MMGSSHAATGLLAGAVFGAAAGAHPLDVVVCTAGSPTTDSEAAGVGSGEDDSEGDEGDWGWCVVIFVFFVSSSGVRSPSV